MIITLCRLTRDVELKTVTVDGKDRSVLNNAIAIRIDNDNSTFIDITAWGRLAEIISKHFKKGDELLIKGELRNKKYKVKINEDEDKEITISYVLVIGFEFTHGKKREVESTEEGEI